MAQYETLVYEKAADKVMRLTLNRPERLNAMSLELLTELDQVMDEFENDADASVLIIRGAGGSFSAGYDLEDTQFAGRGFRVATDRRAMQRLIAHWMRLFDLPKPTIAQVHGYCIAGATELAGHCDLVFAAEDALFGNPAGRVLGILPTMDGDVADADGAAPDQGVFLHRRHLHRQAGRAMGLDKPRLPARQT
jgi:enoyl-CoA hydratase